MRILLVHQYFLEKNDAGGSRWNEMASYWASKGHEIIVLAGMVHYATGMKPEKYKNKKFFVETYSPGITVYRCHVSESYNKSFIGRLWAYFSFVFSASWAGVFKIREKHDVVLVTSPPLFVGITGLILKWLKRIPMVFEVRDLWPESAIDTGVLQNRFIINLAYFFEKVIYKKSVLINTLTPAFKKKLIEEKNVSSDKVLMIPNAADFVLSEKLADFDSECFRSNLGWTDKFVILYVGAHGVANHLIQLIDVATNMQDTNVHFVFVGDGMQKHMLINESQKRNLTNVEFLDPVPKQEVFKYILASDMGASVLKKVDTFKTIYSNKTFDYFSCKKPILMCIDGVSRELLEKANGGLYAEPENIVDIENKVRYAINSQDEICQMGVNGYNYTKNNFDRLKLADLYISELQKINNNV